MAIKKNASKSIGNKIENEVQYESIMKNIDGVMRKGEKKLSASGLSKLKAMAEAAEQYEDFNFPLPSPKFFQK